MKLPDDLLPEEQDPRYEELITLLQQANLNPLLVDPTERAQILSRARARLFQTDPEVSMPEEMPLPADGGQASPLSKPEGQVGKQHRSGWLVRQLNALAAVLVIVAIVGAWLLISMSLPQTTTGISTSSPRPPHRTAMPALSPTPHPYPHVVGNYNGTIEDTTKNITTNMALSIQQQPGQGNISGHFTVHQPLSGSGPFTGTVNTSTFIQFTVTGKNTSPLYFSGWVQSNGDLNGNYCSLDMQNQCDPNAGASGYWNVAPATGSTH